MVSERMNSDQLKVISEQIEGIKTELDAVNSKMASHTLDETELSGLRNQKIEILSRLSVAMQNKLDYLSVRTGDQ